MPKGIPREWTLEELQTIWSFDGDNGESTTAVANGMGISHSHWYGMRSRLHTAGGPEALFAELEDSKTRRYNRASEGRVKAGSKQPDTLEEALTRLYLIRVGAAGRGGKYNQFTVTIPPIIAAPFVAKHGQNIVYEPREDGILIKPAPRITLPEIPAWMEASPESAS